jgi:hypothetical protein
MTALDRGSANPRLQCFECGRWMRLHGKRLEVVNGKPTEVAVQRFYGGCEVTEGDHPCGSDVCSRCCPDKCRARAALATVTQQSGSNQP